MRHLEFECAPSVTGVMEGLGDLSGRFVLEDVGSGRAIIGAEPALALTSKDGVTVAQGRGSGPETLECDPFEVLRRALARFGGGSVETDVPFAGGAVGYLSYDLGRSVERVPSLALEDVPTPDYCLGFYDSALVVDLERGGCTAVSWSGDERAVRRWRQLALETSQEAQDVSGFRCDQACRVRRTQNPETPTVHSPSVRTNFTKAGYLDAIRKVKDYIAAGDVYQVNLSQRFEAELACSAWDLYEALRAINPAPQSCFMEIGPLTLVSASPESFLTYDPLTRIVRTRPIKGTRPRGTTPTEDARLAAELAASEKDRAENLMIVDMERNDLGRVARYGSVEVTGLWEIEAHPNVFQMVSTVEAELAGDRDEIDLLRAAFPGGSITGAPKVRAMEIIEELEPHRRGIYTGSAGFIDFRGRMDLSIVIRSFVVHGSTAYFHAGGGIVADSDPEAEYQETLDKVSGLAAALAKCRADSP